MLRRAGFWLLLAATLVVGALLPDPSLDPASGARSLPTIIDFELAARPDASSAIVGAWESAGTLTAARGSLAGDFAFLLLYSATLAFGARWAGRVYLSGRTRSFARSLSWLAVAAGLLDAIENLALLAALEAGGNHVAGASVAAAAAYPKFGIVIALLAYVGGAGITWLQQRIRGIAGRTDWLQHPAPLTDAPAERVPPWRVDDWKPAPGRIGVACSGGGIRSAAYNLGALQRLQESGKLQRASYLSAVSGGSYLAGAWAILRSHTDPELASDPPAFATTSPEEDWLRNHSAYIAPTVRAAIGAVGRYLLGVLANVVFLGLLVFVVCRPFGWMLGSAWIHPSLSRATPGPLDVREAMWLSAGTLLGVAVALAFVAVAGRVAEDARRRMMTWSRLIAGLGIAVLSVLVLLPWLISHLPGVLADARAYVPVLERSTGPASGRQTRGDGSTVAWLLQASGVAATAAAGVRAMLAKHGGRIAMAVGAALPFLLVLLAGIVITAGGAWIGPLGSARFFGAPLGSEAVLWLGAAAGLAVFYRFADQTAWSLHPFYKRRLSSAFALRRVRLPGGGIAAREIDYGTYLTLSKFPGPPSGPADGPQLVVCAAAAVSDQGLTPVGRRAVSYTFSSTEVGGPGTGWMPTDRFEQALADTKRLKDATLMAAIAISGAAVSPAMGKMRESALGPLFAFVNARLGVWLPSLRWMRRLPAGRHWPDVPRPRYLLNELIFSYRSDDRFTYVTDGGHWENLGLVELLRRGCTEIYCFDASGDQVDTFSTLGEAVALARTELDVRIDIDPFQEGPEERLVVPAGLGARERRRLEKLRRDPRLASHDHWGGVITYPDGTHGRIVVVKLAVTPDAPFDVRAYAAKDREFPTHPTSDQLFDHQKFEAYRALGYASCGNALLEMARPLPFLEVFAGRVPRGAGGARAGDASSDGRGRADRNHPMQRVLPDHQTGESLRA